MRTKGMTGTILAGAALLALSGCDNAGAPGPEPKPSSSAVPAPDATADASAAPELTRAAAAEEALDFAALTERDEPVRLLRFYANALRQGQWRMAALAWDSDAHVTAEVLQKAYQRDVAPELALGKGTSEGAAGSLFYEAPVVLNFGAGSESLRGTITLRRANDVPGASEEELCWRIERSTIGPQI